MGEVIPFRNPYRESHQIEFNIAPDLYDSLEGMYDERGIDSVDEGLRRAVALFLYAAEQQSEGKELILAEPRSLLDKITGDQRYTTIPKV